MNRTIPYHAVKAHNDRLANRAHRTAMADEAGQVALELRRIADKYGYSPHTVAKIAVARARV